jgi:hypothetical protein
VNASDPINNPSGEDAVGVLRLHTCRTTLVERMAHDSPSPIWLEPWVGALRAVLGVGSAEKLMSQG